jgi:hypothetical protein
MAATNHSVPPLNLYQLLGVPQEASRQEIALVWRRRARDEHPDTRPADGDAPGRFRALAEAWHVLDDPARRAAYDRALDRGQQAAAAPAVPVRVPVRHLRRPVGGLPLVEEAEPALSAGPVQVESPGPGASAGSWVEERTRLAIVAEFAVRYLDWPW